jgi:hypothetical protein
MGRNDGTDSKGEQTYRTGRLQLQPTVTGGVHEGGRLHCPTWMTDTLRQPSFTEVKHELDVCIRRNDPGQ